MNMKKQSLLGVLGVVIITLACSFTAGITTTPTPADKVGTVVAATMQALTAAPGQTILTQAGTQTDGVPVSFEYATFLIPKELASGATPETVPAVGPEGGAPWEVAPAHLKFTLAGYPLKEKFHE